MNERLNEALNLEDLAVPETILSRDGVYALVGWYVRVEQKHARVAQRIREIREDGDVGDAEQELEAALRVWMTSARNYLPDWFMPDYLDDIRIELNHLLDVITQEKSASIQEGKGDHTPEGQHYNTGKQRAYDKSRSGVWYIWNFVAHRRRTHRRQE